MDDKTQKDYDNLIKSAENIRSRNTDAVSKEISSFFEKNDKGVQLCFKFLNEFFKKCDKKKIKRGVIILVLRMADNKLMQEYDASIRNKFGEKNFNKLKEVLDGNNDRSYIG